MPIRVIYHHCVSVQACLFINTKQSISPQVEMSNSELLYKLQKQDHAHSACCSPIETVKTAMSFNRNVFNVIDFTTDSSNVFLRMKIKTFQTWFNFIKESFWQLNPWAFPRSRISVILCLRECVINSFAMTSNFFNLQLNLQSLMKIQEPDSSF